MNDLQLGFMLGVATVMVGFVILSIINSQENVMDIGSRSSYPAGKLSNFTGFHFVFDGVECSSMEGFLQALKFENISSQLMTCALVGFTAKKKGRGRTKYWQQKQTLWWNGASYPRKSKAYQYLLNRAYNALYEQNENFRNALNAAGAARFTHSIGRNNKKETVLTESEFCKRLQHLKDIGLLEESGDWQFTTTIIHTKEIEDDRF